MLWKVCGQRCPESNFHSFLIVLLLHKYFKDCLTWRHSDHPHHEWHKTAHERHFYVLVHLLLFSCISNLNIIYVEISEIFAINYSTLCCCLISLHDVFALIRCVGYRRPYDLFDKDEKRYMKINDYKKKHCKFFACYL